MKKVFFGSVMLLSMAILPLTGTAQTNQQVSDEIIAIVKAQWNAERTDPLNVAKQFENIADDYTEFNGDYATRLDGKALILKLAEGASKDPNRVMAGEMLNPKVQVYGDTAILSYNFAGVVSNKEGETKATRAKSTRVYAKIGGKWKLVHANFAPDPLPKN